MEFEKNGEFSFDTLTIEYANGEKKSIRLGTGLWRAGQKIAEELDLNGSDAPMKYVRPKITFTANGEEYISYGIGCYCGAANFTKNEIELSYQHNAQTE